MKEGDKVKGSWVVIFYTPRGGSHLYYRIIHGFLPLHTPDDLVVPVAVAMIFGSMFPGTLILSVYLHKCEQVRNSGVTKWYWLPYYLQSRTGDGVYCCDGKTHFSTTFSSALLVVAFNMIYQFIESIKLKPCNVKASTWSSRFITWLD